MDSVTTLLDSLTARGIAVAALADGRLRVTPAHALTDADRARIADAKPAILARLTGRPTWSPTGRSWFCPCGASVSAVGLAAGLPCPFCGTEPPNAVPRAPGDA